MREGNCTVDRTSVEEFPASDAFAAPRPARPRTVAETGLSALFLADLLVKQLHEGGVLTLNQLARRTALAGAVLEELVEFLRREARVEVRPADATTGALRYALTERGRQTAMDALARCGYVGAAPVTLAQYTEIVRTQSVHTARLTHAAVHDHFSGVVIGEALLDQLGPALHSGRAIFVYGPAGTGKTYITRLLAGLLGEPVLVPHAISVNETVIQLLDPLLHRAVDQDTGAPALLLQQGHDPRYVRCARPAIVTGGELTLDMLDLHYDAATRIHQVPLQTKANNGMFIIDDLGRQRMDPMQLLNRWIVPMEERRDYLSLGAGRHFTVPFDVVLVFSTNKNPLELADAAFLRRLGYKIRFDYLEPDAYARIWRQECTARGLRFDAQVLNYVLGELHFQDRVPLLPCHPRDLLGLACDEAAYLGEPHAITHERIHSAWKNYFVKLDDPVPPMRGGFADGGQPS